MRDPYSAWRRNGRAALARVRSKALRQAKALPGEGRWGLVHPNAAIVQRFYAAFHARDADAMAACYHEDVSFRDPVFGELRGPRAVAMWRMLVGRAKDLTVTVTDVTADDARGSATWTATYRFGKRGRLVRNVIRARFEFKDGRIRRHVDSFSLWRWSGMALGPPGWLLGWTPLVRSRIRRDALRGLDAAVAAARGSTAG